MTRPLRLAGCDLSLTLDPRLEPALLSWLAGFVPGLPDGAATVSWSWSVVPVTTAVEPPADARPLVDYYYVSGAREGNRIVFRTDGGSWLSFDPATGAARAFVTESAIDDAPWALRDLFSAALTALLRTRDRWPIHAAGLVSSDRSAGVLIVGPPMSGKTSLAINFLRRGWTLLSDDKTLLARDGIAGDADAPVQMSGLVRAANVDPMLARHFPELADLVKGAPAHPHSPKRQVRLDRAYDAVHEGWAAVTHLLFPRVIDAGPTLLEPLDSRNALFRLVEQSPLIADRDDAGRQLRLLGALAGAAQGVSLRLGRDLLEDDASLIRLGESLGLPIGASRHPSPA
jgi:hypothetical protein